jgi:hypothetical protein
MKESVSAWRKLKRSDEERSRFYIFVSLTLAWIHAR